LDNTDARNTWQLFLAALTRFNRAKDTYQQALKTDCYNTAIQLC
jgi:hypothetical protein